MDGWNAKIGQIRKENALWETIDMGFKTTDDKDILS